VGNAQALFTPEAFYPLTGIKDLIPNVSVSEGVTILDNAIQQQLNAGNNVAVAGFSQSSIIASLEMAKLDPSGTPSSLPIVFSLLGDPMNPNGGLLARFPGLTMPSLGFTFYGATPGNDFVTNIYTMDTTASPTSRNTRLISWPTSTPLRASTTCTALTRISHPYSLLRLFR
jgi:PE-PPE domain